MSHTINSLRPEGQFFKLSPCEGSEILAVIFATVSVKPGRFSFFKNMENQKVHKLYVNDKNNGWYQRGIEGLGDTVDETISEINALKKELGAKEVVMIGSSMGGHGAILYGAKMGCRVLAFGAEVELKTARSRSLRYMPKDSPVYFPDLKKLIKNSSIELTLMSGECDYADIKAAYSLKDINNVNVITLQGVAHGAPAFLDQKYGIGNIFEGFLLNKSLPFIPEEGKMCEVDSAITKVECIERDISENNWENARGSIAKLAFLYPNSSFVHHKLGIIMYNIGEYELSEKHQREAINISPHYANAHHQLGISLRKLRKFSESLEHHKLAIDCDKNLIGAYHHAGLSLEKLDRYDEAEEMFRYSSLKDKNNKNYNLKFAEILRQNAFRKLEESEKIIKVVVG